MGKRKSDDLDFMAPAHLGPAQDDDFFTAPVKAARQRQAAQGHGPGLDSPYPGPPTPITPLTDNFNNNIVGKNDNNINQYNGPQPSSGSPFTPQELNFLTHYILEKHSKYKSMILAG